MTQYTEPVEELTASERDISRAITSLREELEAVDFYNQRAKTSVDKDLAGIMIHNRDEEIEHAAMLIEYLRRILPKFDEELKNFLFTSGSLVAKEGEVMGRDGGEGAAVAGGKDLGIGSLKK